MTTHTQMPIRVIKFRAWIPAREKKGMLAAQSAYMATQDDPDLETLQSFMHHYGDENNLMQFTGKKDNREIEIYEDDIVQDIKGMRYKVEWNDDILRWQLSDGSPLNDGDRYGCYLIVIGNIYSNPELLNT